MNSVSIYKLEVCLAASPAAHLTSSGNLLPKKKTKYQQKISFLEFIFFLYECAILGAVSNSYVGSEPLLVSEQLGPLMCFCGQAALCE